jgi:hypothetical protein
MEKQMPVKDLAYIETLGKAIIAIAEDGWLYHGPEGMSPEQETLYAAYRLVTGMDVKENGMTTCGAVGHQIFGKCAHCGNVLVTDGEVDAKG